MAPNLNAERKRKRMLALRLQKTKEQLKALPVGQEAVLIEDLISLRDKFEQNFEILCALSPDEEMEGLVTEYNEHLSELNIMMATLKQTSQVSCSSPNPSTINGNAEPHLRLPKIQLPTFSGISTEWPSFSALFQDGLNSYPTLSEPQKLLLLTNSLKGPAKSVVASIAPSATGFKEAWDLLKLKYENKRDILYQLVARIFDNAPVSSPVQIEKLIDTTREVLRSLQLLGYSISKESDIWLVPFILQRLDEPTRFHWEQSKHCSPTSLATIEDLLTFLQVWAKTRVNAGTDYSHSTQNHNSSASSSNATPSSSKSATSNLNLKKPSRKEKCPHCELMHLLYKCPSFLKATIEDRLLIADRLKVCKLCLRVSHKTSECEFQPCRKCKGKHSTLLHKEKSAKNSEQNVANSTIEARKIALLPTARLQIKDVKGTLHPIRVLLDQCATASYLTEATLDKLRLPYSQLTTSVSTVHGQVDTNLKETEAEIYSNDLRYCNKVRFLSMSSPQFVPTSPISIELPRFKDLQLADPTFYEPSQTDGIIGADLLSTIYYDKIVKINGFTLIDSVFGWVISGLAPPLSVAGSQKPLPNLAMTAIAPDLEKFWCIEEVPNRPFLTPEQSEAERVFKESVRILPNGTFQVKMPLRNNPPKLGSSYGLAAQRLKAVEIQMAKNETLRSLYHDTFREYLQLGHMVKAPFVDNAYFLPHHGILKNPTKLRIVFDASAKTSTGLSLNHETLDCPKTQPDLFHILLKFRQYQIAISVDIRQMYRQVRIDPSQHHLQSILWRFNPSEPIQAYQLTTVVWGTKSAPFLATRVLNEIGDIIAAEDPHLADIIQHHFYIDDGLFGCNSVQEAIDTYQRLTEALGKHGFELHKWATNSPEVRSVFPADTAESLCITKQDPSQNKTLGIFWNFSTDSFSFKFSLPQLKKLTKRSVLAQANSIYDPHGWLVPITLQLKLFVQRLWKNNKDWDETLSKQDQAIWRNFIDQINVSSHLSLPRKVMPEAGSNPALCAFCDASEAAYAAVVFLRTEISSGVHVELVAAKSRLAPTRPVTLPRLELCGALLLTRLIKSIQETFPHPLPVYAYTDSTVALGWISSHPSRWKTFVAHRVDEIQQVVPPSQWRHVAGTENPADYGTRPMSIETLSSLNTWWQGPSFLRSNNFASVTPIAPTTLEQKPTPVIVNVTVLQPLFEWKSSFLKNVRIMSYILRFVNNTGKKGISNVRGPLRAAELHFAETIIWKIIQAEGFGQDYKLLLAGKPLPVNSKILPLSPFIDKVGVVRVGGRLKHADLPYERKFPILLPHHPVTDCLIKHFHIVHCHAGPNALAAILQTRYWIPNIISRIKRITHKCPPCLRWRAQTATQKMADLPPVRLTPSRTWATTGIDFAGPIWLKTQLPRSSRQYKAWIAIFICMTTKAIHLELVTGLDADSFLGALHRFVSRRGKPHTIKCDNAGNFVKSARLLEKWQAEAACNNEGIKWEFIPAHGPHFGALWESNIKSMKFHLLRVIGETPLTYELMYTLLTRVEATLNSRPLTALSSDPNDLRALCPSHFIIQDQLHALPEEELPGKIPPLKRWLHVQKMAEHFWNRFSKEYITRLQQRPKWLKPLPNLKVGQLVLVKEDNTSPHRWPLARIEKVHEGKDGLVRAATVRTALRTYNRPIVKLAYLPYDE